MSITAKVIEKESKKCSVCGETKGVIFRFPDGKDRCVKCAAKYELDKEETR